MTKIMQVFQSSHGKLTSHNLAHPHATLVSPEVLSILSRSQVPSFGINVINNVGPPVQGYPLEMVGVVRRHRHPDESLKKEAMKIAPELTKKKEKNVSKDPIERAKSGRFMFQINRLEASLPFKPKGVKRERMEAKEAKGWKPISIRKRSKRGKKMMIQLDILVFRVTLSVTLLCFLFLFKMIFYYSYLRVLGFLWHHFC